MQNSNAPIIRAIDLGFGMVKLTRNFDPRKLESHCFSFPSITAKVSPGDQSPGNEDGITSARKTKFVTVNGSTYAVGPDARESVLDGSGRVRAEEYIETTEYMALSLGALCWMQLPEDSDGNYTIDVLVVGLPVSSFKDRRDELKNRMTGIHHVDGKNYNIKNVVVVRQPHGAYADFVINSKQSSEIKNEVTLVVDAGYFTFDWLWMKGNAPADQLSYAVNNGGMASVLDAVIEQMYLDEKDRIPKLTKGRIVNLTETIDEALRTGTEIRIGNLSMANSISHYRKVALKRADYAVSEMMKKIGERDLEINNIIATGGGSHLYSEVLKDKFPCHTIHVSDRPAHANARGYALLGAQWANINLKG
jgi:PRTRC genetic system protein D